MKLKRVKILDTSSIIMLIKEIEAPEIFEIISELGYKIEVLISVYGEIKGQFGIVKKLVDLDMITILDKVHIENFIELKNKYPKLGNGELEVLTYGNFYENKGDIGYHCIFDDGLPRKVAVELGINCTGSVGLLNHICKSGCFLDDKIKYINKKLDDCRVPNNLRIPY